jgi:addiction module HigA family antidote
MKPIHPGEILKEEFIHDSSLTALATNLGISIRYLSEIIRGKRNISIPVAYKLSAYYGNSPKFWINLQLEYNIQRYEQALGIITRIPIKPRSIPLARVIRRKIKRHEK